MTRRVAITGMGTVNSISCQVEEFWHALCAGRNGIGLIEQIDTTAFKVKFGGEVKNFKPEEVIHPKVARHLDRFAQFALIAAIDAVKQSGIDFSREDPYRCGAIVGSGIGGLNEFEEQHARFLKGGPGKVSPFVIPKMIPNAAAGNISIHFGLCGPNTAVLTACASAANAIGDAMRALQWNYADVVVTGGSEAVITNMGLGGFISAKALSTRNENPPAASRPFERDRDGFVLSEGAGILVLEELEHARRRHAPILGNSLAAARRQMRTTLPPLIPRAAVLAKRCNSPCTMLALIPRTSSTSTPTAPALRWATRPKPRPSSKCSADMRTGW